MWIKVRYRLWLSLRLLTSNLKGGNAIWGNSTHAPDDPDNRTQSHGNFFSFRTDDLKPQNVSDSDPTYSADGLGLKRSEPRNMTADEAGTWILEHTPVTFQVCCENILTGNVC